MGNVWAPRYAQMGMLSLNVPAPGLSASKEASLKEATQIAMDDVNASFKAFLEERPDKQRPFIVLAHSQGSILMTKALKDCLTPEHAKSFVAAYLAGGYVPQDVVPLLGNGIHICDGPEDTNCIISWDTRLKEIFKPEESHDGMLGLWPQSNYYHLFDKYCEEPVNKFGGDAKNDASDAKPSIQINPCTWSNSDGPGDVGYLGAKVYGSNESVKPSGENAQDFAAGIHAGANWLW